MCITATHDVLGQYVHGVCARALFFSFEKIVRVLLCVLCNRKIEQLHDHTTVHESVTWIDTDDILLNGV